VVVASVSCIFGLGAPEDYLAMRVDVETGTELGRDKLLYELISMHYERNDVDFHRGVFRVRGDRVEIFPAYEENIAIRIDFFGDQVEDIALINALRGKVLKRLKRATIFPASHYVTSRVTRKHASDTITAELKKRVAYFRNENKLIEAQRIEERTHFDLEMMQELGYCHGIENYSRHLTGRKPGEPPPTLLSYFPFRLPSALDNRPLKFEESQARISQVIYVSATPADYELSQGKDSLVELIVRPTGLVDPEVEVRSAQNQVDDLYEEILNRQKRHERILVTTLTKRMAEDLTEYYADLGIRVRYLHSDINTLERMDIIQDLRRGKFDVLVGINLLREGLDIPEVSLVAILDADKEGFLRSTRSLIQTFGRAARNSNGTVLLYADKVTRSMRQAMGETQRRRKIQDAYNQAHNITPETIRKKVTQIFDFGQKVEAASPDEVAEDLAQYKSLDDVDEVIKSLDSEMQAAAKALEFERAAELRDQIKRLKKLVVFEI
jgi:excinuclease ABC subunit B